MSHAVVLQVIETSQVGEARRVGQRMAEDLSFDETSRGKVALIITEASTNLIKHAGGGELILLPMTATQPYGLLIIATDRGPGLASLERCLRDGYSTTGTLGEGLGSISRLCNDLDVFSEPGKGTILVAQIWASAHQDHEKCLGIGAVSIPYPGEHVCGDRYSVHEVGSRTAILVVDGLGHGIRAAAAADEALRVFDQCHDQRPKEILQTIHNALKKTCGAAATVTVIDRSAMTIDHCGVGNITALMVDRSGTHSLVSLDGTAGHSSAHIREYQYLWTAESTLILHSDGLSSRLRPDYLDKALAHTPSLVAALLLRDCKRRRDDVIVLVAKEPRAGDAGLSTHLGPNPKNQRLALSPAYSSFVCPRSIGALKRRS